MELLLQLVIIILATKIAGAIAVRFGQPSVLGEIIVGIIIGPAVLGLIGNINDNELLHTFSELGVIFLMFFAGVETNIKDLTSNTKSALTVAVFGVVLPLVGGYLIGESFGMDPTHSLFLGIVLTATSVSISVQTFRELNQLKTRESATVLGAAIADDILGLILLAVVISITVGGDVSIPTVLMKQVIFFAVIILANWKVVPAISKIVAKFKSTDISLVFAVVLCFAYSYFADFMGISNIIGAFFAGLSLAADKSRIEFEEKLLPTVGVLFIPVFFAGIGLAVTFKGIGEHIGLIVILCVVAVLTKIVGAGIGARITGFKTISAILIGIAMVSRGEVALITSGIGLEKGLFTQEYYTPLIIAVVFTTVVTPPLLKWIISIKEKRTSV
ncbi:cation:proton antiporter [Rummeliibacillus stabekisii]|uniref:Sodium:proton antiporter n=1 Tax=Rummeliibacillus stabekisii TaxID=241244 RepID=A0A143HB17_9BACL|nr:cation:proton antiporter [Rummeliibacillus stabekisii]AMW98908.1 sodium:proton antiporter [Rummeliibacillus stabekisii]